MLCFTIAHLHWYMYVSTDSFNICMYVIQIWICWLAPFNICACQCFIILPFVHWYLSVYSSWSSCFALLFFPMSKVLAMRGCKFLKENINLRRSLFLKFEIALLCFLWSKFICGFTYSFSIYMYVVRNHKLFSGCCFIFKTYFEVLVILKYCWLFQLLFW